MTDGSLLLAVDCATHEASVALGRLHADEAEILAHCKERGLYGYNLPRAFRFTKRIPKTPAGKIRKSELEKEFGA